jgi:hypothetical protein
MHTFSQSAGAEHTVGITMIYLILGLDRLALFFQVRARAAVVGSRQRYVSLSLRRLTSWAINLVFSLLKRLNPARRRRSNPRVIKRKISKWLAKRDHHTHWAQPKHSPQIHLQTLT